MKFKPCYFIFSIALITGLLSACAKDEPKVDNTVPTNLSVVITPPASGTGIVKIEATAINTVEYRLYSASSTSAIASNATGKFDYEVYQPGTYQIEVRAYGSSGRYIKEVKQFSLNSDDPVTIGEGYTTPISYAGYNLVWNDEFDGTSLNSQNWTPETGAGGWGNNELQYYKADNASVSGGLLTIEARNETYQNSSYTSARLISKNKQTFTYGRVDIRALLPKGQGIWPALWTLGNNIGNVGWPACGEIDIMEMVGGNNREKTVHGTVHWDNGGHVQSGQPYTLPSGIFADEYHVFTIIWDETKITWYVNDIKFNEVDITPSHMSEFHLPQFFIFNVAVGGIWPGNPDGTTVFPQQMKVDYIRVFQKN